VVQLRTLLVAFLLVLTTVGAGCYERPCDSVADSGEGSETERPWIKECAKFEFDESQSRLIVVEHYPGLKWSGLVLISSKK
jgi:hypothetical protein